jgi:hypothetical protein
LAGGQPATVTLAATLVASGTLTQAATVYWGWGLEQVSEPVSVTIEPRAIYLPLVLRRAP